MLEMPIATKVVPIAIAGMIALTPISPEHTVQVLEAAKSKVVTVIKKEGYNTTFDDQGNAVKVPWGETITIEQPDTNSSGGKKKEEKGIISRTIKGTIDTCKSVCRWVKS